MGSELVSELKDAQNTWKRNWRSRTRRHVGEVGDDEKYMDISRSWAWIRIADTGLTQTGATPNSADAGLFGDFIPFIRPANLDGKEINYGGTGLSKCGVGYSRTAPENSFLMVCIGATLGKVNKSTLEVCFNQQINSLTPFVEGIVEFLLLALRASDFQKLAWAKAGTGTIPIISKRSGRYCPFPCLPSLSNAELLPRPANC